MPKCQIIYTSFWIYLCTISTDLFNIKKKHTHKCQKIYLLGTCEKLEGNLHLFLLNILECIAKLNKRAQRTLGRSPEEKVKGHSGAIYREPQGHNLNNFGRGPFDDVIYEI